MTAEEAVRELCDELGVSPMSTPDQLVSAVKELVGAFEDVQDVLHIAGPPRAVS